MLSNNVKRLDLINMLCRICAREDSKSISIFGPEGIKQDIVKKIKACMPITISQNDGFPKQICLTCLTKLDSFWEMQKLCKEAQVRIEKKFYSLRKENCAQSHIAVEEKLKNLTEGYPVSYGDSAVICLAPRPPTPQPAPPAPAQPTAAVTREGQAVAAGPVEPVMIPVTYLAPAAPPPAVPSTSALPVVEEVYPQTLIQVPQNPASEPPVVYQNRTVTSSAPAPAPPAVPRKRASAAPLPKPIASPQRPVSTPLKRQNSEPPAGPPGKKCHICNKYFSDDIIDHHVSLHMRISFHTCLDCNKNFRAEVALLKHRCEPKHSKSSEPINLDPDDDEPIVV